MIKFGTGGWREGKTLVDRELQSRGTDGTLSLDNRDYSFDVERGSDSRLLPNPSLGQRRDDRAGQRAFRDDGVQDANTQFNATIDQEVPEDDSPRHFYQDIGERVKNTFDMADSPDWIKSIVSFLLGCWIHELDCDFDKHV